MSDFFCLDLALGLVVCIFVVLATVLAIEIHALFREIHRDDDSARRGPSPWDPEGDR